MEEIMGSTDPRPIARIRGKKIMQSHVKLDGAAANVPKAAQPSYAETAPSLQTNLVSGFTADLSLQNQHRIIPAGLWLSGTLPYLTSPYLGPQVPVSKL